MRTSTIALAALLTFWGASVADAHITLMSPSPRTASQKQGPCGAEGGTRGTPVTYKPGETITVRWDETVDHVGHYRLAFDMDGQDDLPLPVNPNDSFPSILVDQIPDRTGGGEYSQEITFPNMECDNCTLQLIQIMTTNVPYNSFYFQCVDIILADDGSGEPTGADAGTGGGTSGEATGSGCQSTGQSSGILGGMLLLLGFASISRRRRHER
ncbi:MAG: lytic polysaccharide monooxygenase [Kofleriaceae bacterium]|nr:lytic polysaccharide monooxygenase [Kofleriaceae bacterium]